jgi:isopenicillin-N N-acyltransferase-like protein
MLRETAGLTDGDLPAHGRRVGEAIAAGWPDLVDELDGIAIGAGVPLDTLLAVNARTELLAGTTGAECSVVGMLDGRGGCVVAQNWDWHPDLAPSRVLWHVQQPGGRWLVTLTEAGILAKVGVSSRGLCSALNLLTCSLDGGVGRAPIHVLLRVVLDRCDTLADALRLLLGAEVTASSCVTLGFAEGGEAALVAVELSPAGSRVLWPDDDGRLVHTNHFLAPLARGVDTQPAQAPSTLLRWRQLRQAHDVEDALRSHFGAPESVCRHEREADPWPERRATLASLVMDPVRRTVHVADGPPCTAPLEAVG